MFLACLFFKLILQLRSNIIYVCLLFLDMKLNTKQGTAKNRIHIFLFIKCIRKSLSKGKQWTCRWEKMNPQDGKY